MVCETYIKNLRDFHLAIWQDTSRDAGVEPIPSFQDGPLHRRGGFLVHGIPGCCCVVKRSSPLTPGRYCGLGSYRRASCPPLLSSRMATVEYCPPLYRTKILSCGGSPRKSRSGHQGDHHQVYPVRLQLLERWIPFVCPRCREAADVRRGRESKEPGG